MSLLLSALAGAQSAYQTNFDGTTPPAGWSLDAPVGTVGWAFDGTPSTAPGGPAQSAPNSLNYNNGTNYAASTTNAGAGTSPQINLSVFLATPAPTLTFGCNYQTEDTGTSYDQRWLEISSDGFATFLVQAQLATSGATGGISDCAAMGTWHTHTVQLDPTWGNVRIRFRFDTIDGILNNYAGWFVDDLNVNGTQPPPPPQPGGGGGGSGAPSGSSSKNNDNGDENFWETICGAGSSGNADSAAALLPMLILLGAFSAFRKLRRVRA